MTRPTPAVTINLVSDFICPWCRIGEKRLADAIRQIPENIQVDVRWLPFQLNPDMPKEGLDRKTYRSAKFGSWDRSRQLDAGTVEAGKPDGVTFNYDRIKRTPNTFAAHKLTYWAGLHAKQADTAHRILNAYFVMGEDIGDPAVLARIAADVGLDPDAASQYLKDKNTNSAVVKLMEATSGAGITGVPHFDIDGTPVYGARSARLLAKTIQAAAKRKQSDGLNKV
ncbi:DsbA family oxidoreductase [Roseibium sp. MB-4]